MKAHSNSMTIKSHESLPLAIYGQTFMSSFMNDQFMAQEDSSPCYIWANMHEGNRIEKRDTYSHLCRMPCMPRCELS